jgi:hypothetical protein
MSSWEQKFRHLQGRMLRKFNLIEIGEGALIEHHIRCRKLDSAVVGEGRHTIRFRPICLLSPGVSVSEIAIIKRRSVLLVEGVQVPNGIITDGNPAFNNGIAPLPLLPTLGVGGNLDA